MPYTRTLHVSDTPNWWSHTIWQTNAVIDVFCEYEKARVLNVDDRRWQYLAPRWCKWAFYHSCVMRKAHLCIWSVNHYLLAFEHLPTRLVQISPFPILMISAITPQFSNSDYITTMPSLGLEICLCKLAEFSLVSLVAVDAFAFLYWRGCSGDQARFRVSQARSKISDRCDPAYPSGPHWFFQVAIKTHSFICLRSWLGTVTPGQ